MNKTDQAEDGCGCQCHWAGGIFSGDLYRNGNWILDAKRTFININDK